LVFSGGYWLRNGHYSSWSRVNESGLTNKSLMFFVTIHDWFLPLLQLQFTAVHSRQKSLLHSRVDLPGSVCEKKVVPARALLSYGDRKR